MAKIGLPKLLCQARPCNKRIVQTIQTGRKCKHNAKHDCDHAVSDCSSAFEKEIAEGGIAKQTYDYNLHQATVRWIQAITEVPFSSQQLQTPTSAFWQHTFLTCFTMAEETQQMDTDPGYDIVVTHLAQRTAPLPVTQQEPPAEPSGSIRPSCSNREIPRPTHSPTNVSAGVTANSYKGKGKRPLHETSGSPERNKHRRLDQRGSWNPNPKAGPSTLRPPTTSTTMTAAVHPSGGPMNTTSCNNSSVGCDHPQGICNECEDMDTQEIRELERLARTMALDSQDNDSMQTGGEDNHPTSHAG